MKSTLQLAAMAAKWWEPPRDALDTMVLNACNKDALSPYKHLDFIPFDPTLKVSQVAQLALFPPRTASISVHHLHMLRCEHAKSLSPCIASLLAPAGPWQGCKYAASLMCLCVLVRQTGSSVHALHKLTYVRGDRVPPHSVLLHLQVRLCNQFRVRMRCAVGFRIPSLRTEDLASSCSSSRVYCRKVQ